MSKLTVTVAVTLAVIFLVTFSDARSPSDQTENDVTETRSDVILLPSQKHESESNPKPIKEKPSPNVQVEPKNFHTVDLTKIDFRPDSRQFRERIVPLSFRVPLRRGHRCHHEHRLFRRREAPEREGSFGDDMIAEKEKFRSEFGYRPVFPVRVIRIHHRKPRFGNMDMLWDDEMTVPRIHHHRHYELEKEEDGEKREHHRHHHHHRYPRYERNGDRANNGFFVKIRKFLSGF